MCWRRRRSCRPRFIPALRGTWVFLAWRTSTNTNIREGERCCTNAMTNDYFMAAEHEHWTFYFLVRSKRCVWLALCIDFFVVLEILYTVCNDDSWRTQCVIQFSFAVQCAVGSRPLAVSTMTSMQQLNPFSRINNKWICVVSLWSLSMWLALEFCYILRCIFFAVYAFMPFHSAQTWMSCAPVLADFIANWLVQLAEIECMSWWGALRAPVLFIQMKLNNVINKFIFWSVRTRDVQITIQINW